ncbi:UPF0764 protein C16orf89 homolog [Stegodyphus dumicola]|uniref:UPF0764 protein C16orf89 homolog n=1 Tax=Stegodyphus dumicola TaxID=202533 RepID=UPI0015A9F4B4|nr:UPF0764 protein C16orf89 homolog [Stegodyphus dumicola]
MNALFRGLQYMEDHVSEINLDGAFGCRLIEEQLRAFLDFSPKIFRIQGEYFRSEVELLQKKAEDVADRAVNHVRLNDPHYYFTTGGLLKKSEKLIWYQSRITNSALKEDPLPCNSSIFNESESDFCLKEVTESRPFHCKISPRCLHMMTTPGHSGYYITHQVLYLEILEKKNCLDNKTIQLLEPIQTKFCTNIMRDAEEISKNNFPLSHQDLFMEQIGLCGLWGFKDFYKRKWVENILEWQSLSGCYDRQARWFCSDNHTQTKLRFKRREQLLKDGCFSHKTAVALLALSVIIRFNAEEISTIHA